MRNLSTYHKVRHLMKAGDCLTWRDKGITQPVGLIIQSFTPNGYHKCAHISSVITAPEYADRMMMMEARGKTGVVPIAISKQLENFPGSVWWHPLDPNIVTDNHRVLMERWLWKQAWKDYDYGDCFKQAFAYISSSADKLFCSELSGGAIKEGCNLSELEPQTDIEAESLAKFKKGLTLRPWDVVALPVFLPMVRII